MLAVQLNAYGDPLQNVELVNIPEPSAPGPDEVLVRLEYSPVNPADLLLAMGYYPVRPSLPSIIGNEGVGKTIAVGSRVSHVKVGDRIAAPLSSFTWRERMLLPAVGLEALPAQADPKQLAMVAINPVAASLLLSEFRPLKPGNWIVQNCANSGVGRAVVAIARERGIHTINIVRRASLVPELISAGADVVLVDGPTLADEVRAAIGSSPLLLAFDGLSGNATGVLASLLTFGGTVVTYGAMSYSPISVAASDLVYKFLNLTSLFIGHSQYLEKFPDLINQAAKLVADGKLHVPIAAVYPLTSIKDALRHAQEGGKVLLEISNGK
jgi:NADPH:quinone reductase-like Zn-dependent oxidoreductase